MPSPDLDRQSGAVISDSDSSPLQSLSCVVERASSLALETENLGIQRAAAYFSQIVRNELRQVPSARHLSESPASLPLYSRQDFGMDGIGEVIEEEIGQYFFSDVIENTQALLPEGFSRDIIVGIARRILSYCIREFDVGFHGTFEDWMNTRVVLCINSLRSPLWNDNVLFVKDSEKAILRTLDFHRTVKNEPGFFAITHNHAREERFSQWCSNEEVLGDNHEERVMAATIHFAPMVSVWLQEQGIDDPASTRKMLFRGMRNLNESLWIYDPSRTDFFSFARKRILLACCGNRDETVESEANSLRNSALMTWSVERDFVASSVVRVQGVIIKRHLDMAITLCESQFNLADFIEEGGMKMYAYRLLKILVHAFHPKVDNEDFFTFATPILEKLMQIFHPTRVDEIRIYWDHESAASYIQSIMNQSHPDSSDQEADFSVQDNVVQIPSSQESLSDLIPTGDIDVEESADDADKTEESDAPPEDPSAMIEAARQESVAQFVRTHIEGCGEVWDYDSAVSELITRHTDDARASSKKRLLKKNERSTKLKKEAESAGDRVLLIAIGSFNPSSEDSRDPEIIFHGHLQRTINLHLQE